MSDFPVLSLRGSTDAERLAELASYIPSLTSAIEREMMSLDFSNLNEGLQQRINNSITEHQDLSGFASKNYAKNHFYEKGDVDNKLDKLDKSLSQEITDTVKPVSQSVNTLNGVVGSYSSGFSKGTLCALVEEIYHQLFERSGLFESDTILDRIKALEKDAKISKEI